MDVLFLFHHCLSSPLPLHGFLTLVFAPSPLSALDLEFWEGYMLRMVSFLLPTSRTSDSGTPAQQGLLTVLMIFF
jgi:hypothetical protein